MTPERWVWLARIKRTQGRKGEVFAEVLTDFPEKFSDRRQLWLLKGTSAGSADVSGNAREVTLKHHWMHKGGVVLHFAGVGSISAAEELTGFIVAIPRAQRTQLKEGDVYIGDLIGCTLLDVAGKEPLTVGEIEDVDRSAGPVAMLVVKSSQRTKEEILVPFAKAYLRRVDVDAKYVEMALPEGLVDLNS
ncbi:MAG: 16S rRNA processing protein RimM [Acidobacteria bacterium]|nr:16S rRNA processing protein RimM [Acidobacteriota bacterium]